IHRGRETRIRLLFGNIRRRYTDEYSLCKCQVILLASLSLSIRREKLQAASLCVRLYAAKKTKRVHVSCTGLQSCEAKAFAKLFNFTQM
ncbi:hypothetical protein, partial [Hominenteromicrobium sp.]|uniref:hypothetical protein n=1 Tax=Hominenteromicrobium sp. TaxID=3073581 RepID=UPI003AB2498F